MVITVRLPTVREESQPPLRLWPFVLALTGHGVTGTLLGRDELVTWAWDVVGRDTGRIVATLGNVDAVHGTYYLLMHGWVELFGDSVVSCGCPRYCRGRGGGRDRSDREPDLRIQGRNSRRISLARAPAVSRCGQEARGYALVFLAVALATLLLLRSLAMCGLRTRAGAHRLSASDRGAAFPVMESHTAVGRRRPSTTGPSLGRLARRGLLLRGSGS